VTTIGSSLSSEVTPPLWLLAELTYRCPLQCPYCSNPLNLESGAAELDTKSWMRLLTEARQLGAAQLGFSGGEPLVRQDLEQLVAHARQLGFYTNLITSGLGLTEARVNALKTAGLDHIQISFQSTDSDIAAALSGSRKAHEQKLAMAQAVKAAGYPMVLNFVLHRENIAHVAEILALAESLGADYIELANTQYHGWALLNRDALIPAQQQIADAEAVVKRYREANPQGMKIYFVVPDYFEQRPKRCMNGWAKMFLTVAPDGTALPCHSAADLPIEFPNLKACSVREAWFDSAGFNRYRGDQWMQEPCRSCPEKTEDLGGCRCQAYALTGDASRADPVCAKSPDRHLIDAVLAKANNPCRMDGDMVYRSLANARNLIAQQP